MEDADGHVRVVLERVPSPRPRDLDDDATLQSEEPAFVSHEHVAPTEPTIAEGSEEGAASDAASQAGAGSGRGDGTAGEASLADVIGTGAGAAPEQPLGSLSRQESPVRLDPGVDVGMGPASSSLSEGAWGSVEGFEDRGSGSGDSGAEVGVEVGARGPLARTWTEEQRDAMALLQRVAKSAVQNMEGESDDEGDEGRRGEDQAGEGTEQAPATGGGSGWRLRWAMPRLTAAAIWAAAGLAVTQLSLAAARSTGRGRCAPAAVPHPRCPGIDYGGARPRG